MKPAVSNPSTVSIYSTLCQIPPQFQYTVHCVKSLHSFNIQYTVSNPSTFNIQYTVSNPSTVSIYSTLCQIPPQFQYTVHCVKSLHIQYTVHCQIPPQFQYTVHCTTRNDTLDPNLITFIYIENILFYFLFFFIFFFIFFFLLLFFFDGESTLLLVVY